MPPDANLIRLPSTRLTVPMCLPSEPFTFICSLICDASIMAVILRFVTLERPFDPLWAAYRFQTPERSCELPAFDAAFNVVGLCSMWLSVPQTAIPPVA